MMAFQLTDSKRAIVSSCSFLMVSVQAVSMVDFVPPGFQTPLISMLGFLRSATS